MSHKLTYAQKLQDPRWKAKRIQILERDKYKCQWCGIRDALFDVHHHYYLAGREPWDYPDCSLVTLCRDCHSKYGNKDETAKALYQMSEDIGFVFLMIICNQICSFKKTPKHEIVLSLISFLSDLKEKDKKGLRHERTIGNFDELDGGANE